MYIWRAKHHLSPSDQIITYLRLSFVLREGTDVASSIFKFDSRAEGFHRAIPQYHMSHASHVCKTVGRPLEDGWLQANFGRNGSAYLCQTLQGPQNPRWRWWRPGRKLRALMQDELHIVAQCCTSLISLDHCNTLQYFAILCNMHLASSCIILHHLALNRISGADGRLPRHFDTRPGLPELFLSRSETSWFIALKYNLCEWSR